VSSLKGLSPETARHLVLSVGTHRGDRPFSPVEVADAMEKAIASGTSDVELAAAIQLMDATLIKRFRRLLLLEPGIRHLVSWRNLAGSISFTSAAEIARLPSRSDQESLARSSIEHQLNSAEVRQIVQILKRSKMNVDTAIASVLTQRPQIETIHVLVGAVLSEQLQHLLRQKTQHERDHILADAVHRQVPTLPACTGHLGIDRFTLSGNESFSSMIRGLPGGFEAAINRYLESEVAF
jgi:hypothetical protein